METTSKERYLDAMAAAHAELRAHPGEITEVQLGAMTALLDGYRADGWARQDWRRSFFTGLACGCLSMFCAIPGTGVVLALAVRAVKAMFTFPGGSVDVALVLALAATTVFTGLAYWGVVAADARHTRICEASEAYRTLKYELRPLRGWALQEADALAKCTSQSQELYDHVTSQGIALRDYHFTALRKLAEAAGRRPVDDDDDYPGGGWFGAIPALVSIGLLVTLVAATTYHMFWP